MFEAHQGHVPGAQRVQRGRFENGAKLVTFDVRMSNTAGNSDEFYMPRPAPTARSRSAMAHTIVSEKLYDAEFFATGPTARIDELWEQIERVHARVGGADLARSIPAETSPHRA